MDKDPGTSSSVPEATPANDADKARAEHFAARVRAYRAILDEPKPTGKPGLTQTAEDVIAEVQAQRKAASLVDAASFMVADIPPIRWLVDQLVPEGPALGLIAGPPKAGKSSIAIQLAIAVGAGLPMLDRPTRPTNVLLAEEEGSPGGLQWRLKAQCRGMGLDVPQNILISHRQRWHLDDPTDLATLEAEIIARNVGLVIIGPLSFTARTEENDNSARGRLAAALVELGTQTGANITVTHHTTKAKGATRNTVAAQFEGVRGASAIVGAIDWGFALDRDPEAVEGRLFVEERDAAAQVLHYHFDAEDTLLVTMTDAPPTPRAKAFQNVLDALLDLDAPQTVKALAEHIGQSDKTVSKYLLDLEKLGDVERDTTGTAHLWSLTSQRQQHEQLRLLEGGAR